MNNLLTKIIIFCLICINSILGHSQEILFRNITIVSGNSASPIERNIVDLLKNRLEEIPSIQVTLRTETKELPCNPDELQILLGTPKNHSLLNSQFMKLRIPGLSALAPGPEGFLLKYVDGPKNCFLIAAGLDERGCLYAVGEILRQVTYKEGQLAIPDNLDIRTAPAFEIRGTQIGQSHIAKKLAKVRDWTKDEKQRALLDYALAGANIFAADNDTMYNFIKSYGLMTQTKFGANTAGPKYRKNGTPLNLLAVPDTFAFPFPKLGIIC
ncbi:MAG: hypothetical protein R2814_12020 [Flavobacteriaceae bacterium]